MSLQISDIRKVKKNCDIIITKFKNDSRLKDIYISGIVLGSNFTVFYFKC